MGHYATFALPDAPNSARIAAVCEREIAAITARIVACSDADGRTSLLRERADIRQLLDFAVRQRDYAAWVAQRASGVDQSC